jgi:NTP pyrophosphatase (non-canonical NTP hydrolase)
MDAITYLTESARTASPNYHACNVDVNEFTLFITRLQEVATLADKLKKAFFYNKRTLSGAVVDPMPDPRNDEINGMERQQAIDFVHAVLGIVSETGELFAAATAHDEVNVSEETGDILWYVAMLLRSSGSTFEESFGMNIAKLRKRFPEKFTDEHANTRDLFAERDTLEAFAKQHG